MKNVYKMLVRKIWKEEINGAYETLTANESLPVQAKTHLNNI
jgi:hypothetical protein